MPHEYLIRIEACPESWDVRCSIGAVSVDTDALRVGHSVHLAFAKVWSTIRAPAEAEVGTIAFGFHRLATGQSATVELTLTRG